ncbi:HpcH/HpaI aldolase/citrate lyase family protein [Bordetella sp. BOR01]|uniref:HpcH/HpaI aldolase family protein n=1 Tax=Bordetella sp. BOR01 TaxID=2854779 RepID=UPI001C497A6A|nr:aldolase/citrate lyase family protein [Bordetella sp. BOR01]MBV7481376.1 aldolase [Bordetella sp. BOR01]
MSHDTLPLRNALKEKLADGQVAVSLIVRSARGPEIALIARSSGFDALYIDLEHSSLSLDTASALCIASQTSGVTPLLRVPEASAAWISRALDGGAMGVIVPHVDDAQAARAAVALAKYPPQGHRSVSTTLPQLAYRQLPQAESQRLLNEATLVVAMIESRQGLRHADEIAAVDGIDMLLVGAGDLAADLGQPGQAQMRAAFDTVIAACRRHGKIVGAGGLAGQIDLLGEVIAAGVRYVSAGTDTGFLLAGAQAKVAAIRARCPPSAESQ